MHPPAGRKPFRVALTFDTEHPDRPSWRPGVTEAIVERLAADHVRVTFFLQGRWVEAHHEVARSIAAGGHLVGNHSFYHARMPLFGDDGLAADVREAERAIHEIVGVDPRPWFRCPFGAGHDDPRVLDGLERLGYRNIHWDVDTEDWEPGRRGETTADIVVDGAMAFGDGAVVLLHAWPDATLDAIGPIVSRLRDAGATFVGLDELEPIDAGRWLDVPGQLSA
jgi:peptidoglycan/xylan/chitin deacetylase (PgdA/CDA1 family)